jgi:hypothetical protein
VTTQEFIRLQEEVQSLREKTARAEGSLAHLKQRLREEFRATPKDAVKLLARLEAEGEKLEVEFTKASREFRRKHPDLGGEE